MFRQLLYGLSRHMPSQCAVCHAWPARPVCESCVQRFGQPMHRCITCALPLPQTLTQCGACVADPPPLDAALAALTYDFPWAGLIVQFKFHQHPGWAPTLASILRSMPWVEPALEAADWVVPMPLSPGRLRERGFNQALELARAMELQKVRPDVLLRIKETPAQSALPRKERLTNVRGAYALAPEYASTIKGRNIVLLDDVMTTGASLHAAAQALRHGGAARVTAMVLARAE